MGSGFPSVLPDKAGSSLGLANGVGSCTDDPHPPNRSIAWPVGFVQGLANMLPAFANVQRIVAETTPNVVATNSTAMAPDDTLFPSTPAAIRLQNVLFSFSGQIPSHWMTFL